MTGPEPYRTRIDVDLRRYETPPLAELRAHIRQMLVAEGPECVEDVELLTTELVTNAYDHGVHPLSTRLWRPENSKVIRLEVDDSDSSHLPVIGVSRFGVNRGRGLVMVDHLAQRWGSRVRTWGKTIWAEVAAPGVTPA